MQQADNHDGTILGQSWDNLGTIQGQSFLQRSVNSQRPSNSLKRHLASPGFRQVSAAAAVGTTAVGTVHRRDAKDV